MLQVAHSKRLCVCHPSKGISMTRKDIILMADASGLSLYGMGKDREQFIDYLECFAGLIASAERKACAKLCEEQMFWLKKFKGEK